MTALTTIAEGPSLVPSNKLNQAIVVCKASSRGTDTFTLHGHHHEDVQHLHTNTHL